MHQHFRMTISATKISAPHISCNTANINDCTAAIPQILISIIFLYPVSCIKNAAFEFNTGIVNEKNHFAVFAGNKIEYSRQ